MLENLIFALEEWPTDNESETLPSTPELASVLKALDTKSELILSYIPQLENENAEYEGLYDIAYSDSHFISGFGRIDHKKRKSCSPRYAIGVNHRSRKRTTNLF